MGGVAVAIGSAVQMWLAAQAEQAKMVSIGDQIAAVIDSQRVQCDREVALVRELLE